MDRREFMAVRPRGRKGGKHPRGGTCTGAAMAAARVLVLRLVDQGVFLRSLDL